MQTNEEAKVHNITAREIFESLEKELEYYRNRVIWGYTAAIGFQLALIFSISGKVNYQGEGIEFTIDLPKPAYVFLFFLLFLFATFVCLAYRERSHKIRKSRSLLVSKSNLEFQDIYPTPGRGILPKENKIMNFLNYPLDWITSTSPTIWYLLIIFVLSLIGIIHTYTQ